MYIHAGPQSPGGVTVIPNPDIEEGLTVIWMEVHSPCTELYNLGCIYVGYTHSLLG